MLRLTLAVLLCHLATAPCRADDAPSIAKLVDKIIELRNSGEYEAANKLSDAIERRVSKTETDRLDLLPLLKHPNSEIRSIAMDLWIDAGGEPVRLEPLLDDNNRWIAFRTARFLLASNSSLNKSTETLLRLRRPRPGSFDSLDSDVDDVFASFSPSLTKRAISLLTDAIKDEGGDLREADAPCLAALPVGADDFTISQLVPLTQNARNRVRLRALQILASTGTDSPEVLAAATRNLSHQDARISLTAAEIIGRISPDRADYLQTILKWLKSPNSSNRDLALIAVQAIGNARHEVVPAIIDSLNKEDQDGFDSLAYVAYDIFETTGPDAVPDLLTAAQHDTNARVRRFAVQMLGVVGPASESDVLPLLVQSLGSDDPRMKQEAIQAIAQFGPQAASAVPKLTALLAHDPDLRDAALDALDKLGPLPKPSLALIESMLNDSDVERRLHAAKVLIHNKVSPETTLPVLLPLVSDEEPQHCLTALDLIAEMGPAARPAIPKLIDALALKGAVSAGIGGYSIVQRVPSTLAAVGPETVAPLTEALESRNPQVRGMAAQTLGQIGPAAAPASDALLARLHDRGDFDVVMGCLGARPTVAQLAIEALANIGPQARSALPRLFQLANEDLARDEIPDEFSPRLIFFEYVIAAIASIGRDDPQAIAGLRTMLHHNRIENSPYDLDDDILRALIQMKPDAETIAEFDRYLTVSNDSAASELGENGEFHEAVDALIRLGDRAEQLKPRLRFLVYEIPLLDPDLRCEAAYALYRLDPDKREGLDYLRAAAAMERRSIYTIIYARDRLEELHLIDPEAF